MHGGVFPRHHVPGVAEEGLRALSEVAFLLGSCPVGAAQNTAAGGRLSLHVMGGPVVSGSVLGRWIWGWLYPEGGHSPGELVLAGGLI